MAGHSHDFVETYDGMVGFGFDRQTDENTIIYYLQKFSDDKLMARLVPKMNDEELEQLFSLINRLMKNHLLEGEYHELFLKQESPH